MILIFDLDDTLYEERTYVESGFQSVAAFGEQHFGCDANESVAFMLSQLYAVGRGKIFDEWLKQIGHYNKTNVKKCIATYRNHIPNIKLNPDAKKLLKKLSKYPLYLVTDGHKLVQQKKVVALGLYPYFRRIFITHRYGKQYAKPSLYCFELIRKREKSDWKDMVYIGDDPSKDFVNLKVKGSKTVRIHQGRCKDVAVDEKFDAQFHLHHLHELEKLLAQWGINVDKN